MPKTLTAFNEEKLDAPYVEPIKLVKITYHEGESDEKIIRLTDRRFNLFSWEEATISDSFTGDDGAPPNPALWIEKGYSQWEIQSNKLNFSGNIGSASIQSQFYLSGNFSVQVDLEVVAEPNYTDTAFSFYLYIPNTDPLEYFLIRTYMDSGSNKYWQVYSPVTEGIQIGRVGTDHKIRFVRSGANTTVFLWVGGQWQWGGDTSGYTFNYQNTGVLYLQLTSSDFGTPSLEVNMDNFVVNSADNLLQRLEQAPPCKFGEYFYDPLILNYGTIKTGEIDPITFETDISEFDFVVANGFPLAGYDSFTDMIAALDLYYAKVEHFEIYGDTADDDDAIKRFEGTIEKFLNMQRDMVTTKCSGMELDISNKYPIEIVNTTDYPNADPDDIGKMLPEVFGSCRKVPFMAVDAGGHTTLAEDITASQTGVINFTDVLSLKNAGTIYIDGEYITYTSKSDSGNTLNVSARGASGTTAAIHTNGSNVWQVQSSYFYIIGHAIKTFNAVYIDKTRQTEGYNTYTGQTGDEHASYPGKAVIEFTTSPYLVKQRNLSIDEGDHEHGDNSCTALFPEYVSVYSPSLSGEDSLMGDNADSGLYVSVTSGKYDGFCQGRANSGTVRYGFKTLKQFGGTPARWRCGFQYKGSGGGRLRVTFDGVQLFYDSYLSVASDLVTVKGSWIACNRTWGQISEAWWDVYMYVYASAHYEQGYCVGHTEWQRLYTCWIEIESSPASSPATGVAITGNSSADIVIGGKVSADIDGWQDDASGTYTGTANALIERPDRILKYIIGNRLSKGSSGYDSDSYDAAGAYYNTNVFKEGIPILKRPNVRELINRIAYQARSFEWWEAGVHHLKYLPDSVSSADKTIKSNRIDAGQIWISFTTRSDIKNKLSAFFKRDWSGYEDQDEALRDAVTAVDTDSQAKYGTLEGGQFTFPYITTETHAQSVIDYLKLILKDVRIIVEFVGGYWLVPLEKGDVVSFEEETGITYTIDSGDRLTQAGDTRITQSDDTRIWHDIDLDEQISDYLEKAMLGLINLETDFFRVIDVNIRPDAATQIKAIKI